MDLLIGEAYSEAPYDFEYEKAAQGEPALDQRIQGLQLQKLQLECQKLPFKKKRTARESQRALTFMRQRPKSMWSNSRSVVL